MDRPFPAYRGNEPYIFVGYAHRDSNAVFQELVWLKESGFNIWYDEGIEVGSEWREELGQAIKDARLFLYFVTSNSTGSENCRKELSFAVDQNIPVISVHLEQTELTVGLKLTLSDRQAILKHEIPRDEYAAKLLGGIRKHLPDNDETGLAPVVSKSGVGKRITRSRSLWVITGLLAISAISMSINESRVWITQTAIGLSFNVAMMLSSNQLDIETGIAVLPFVNMSSDPENEYFSDGLSDQIIDALVKSNRMNVIARTSSFSFKGKNKDVKEIGRTLGVTHILEGSVQKANNNLRIIAQLVDASTGAHLWSETYDRELLDIFEIQDDIAEKITKQVDWALGIDTKREPAELITRGTQSTVAFDLFLQAQHFANIDNPFEMEKAIPLYEQAIAEDNDYADAWNGLAETYIYLASPLYSTRTSSEVLPIAIDAARKVLEIEPNHAHAMGLLGWALMNQEFKWNEGAELMEKSIALNPSDAEIQAFYGLYLVCTRQDNAASVVDKAYRLNPLGNITIGVRTMEMFLSGRYMDAASLIETTLIRNREGYAANFLAATVSAGRPDIAKLHRDKVREIVGADHPTVRLLDMLIAFDENERDVADSIQQELLGMLRQNRVVPLPFGVARNAEELIEVFNIIIEQRGILMFELFGPKPEEVSTADWNRIKELTRASEVRPGSANYDSHRTENEIEALRSTAVRMTDRELDIYVGDYREQKSDWTLTIEKDGGELRLVFPEGHVDGAISVGNHFFKELEKKSTLKFTVDNGTVTQLTRRFDIAPPKRLTKVK
jgi:TolB-like protein/Tfp pilus assembly protein PilF